MGYKNFGKDKRPNDEWYTPPEIFDALGLTFDLDPCAPRWGSHVPSKQRYTLPFDGLEAPWFGIVWVNPPYSQPALWAHKWLEHGNGLLLVVAGKSKWRLNLWNDSRTSVINLTPPKFVRPDGSRKQIMFPVDLWAIGDQAIEALHQSGLGKVR